MRHVYKKINPISVLVLVFTNSFTTQRFLSIPTKHIFKEYKFLEMRSIQKLVATTQGCDILMQFDTMLIIIL